MAKLVEKVPDLEKRRVVFKFEDNTETVFDLTKVPGYVPEISGTALQLMSHGGSQKIGDSYSNSGDEEVTDDPLAYAKGRVADTIARLYAGDWRTAVAGTGGILAEAMSVVSGKPREECAAALADMSDTEKKEFRKKKKIAAALMRIKHTRDEAKLARLEAAAAASDE